MRTSTSPAAGAATSISSSATAAREPRTTPRWGTDDISGRRDRREPRAVEIAHRASPREREVEIDLRHQVLDQLLHLALPADRERVRVGAPEQPRVRTERHRFQ